MLRAGREVRGSKRQTSWQATFQYDGDNKIDVLFLDRGGNFGPISAYFFCSRWTCFVASLFCSTCFAAFRLARRRNSCSLSCLLDRRLRDWAFSATVGWSSGLSCTSSIAVPGVGYLATKIADKWRELQPKCCLDLFWVILDLGTGSLGCYWLRRHTDKRRCGPRCTFRQHSAASTLGSFGQLWAHIKPRWNNHIYCIR